MKSISIKFSVFFIFIKLKCIIFCLKQSSDIQTYVHDFFTLIIFIIDVKKMSYFTSVIYIINIKKISHLHWLYAFLWETKNDINQPNSMGSHIKQNLGFTTTLLCTQIPTSRSKKKKTRVYRTKLHDVVS